jgi:PadR family transcriptional regulator, regulatory protein PadR
LLPEVSSAMTTTPDLAATEHWEQSVRRSLSRLFLLAALAERPMHGYELAQAVEAASGGCCSPSDAAIYPAIRELSEGGYIACTTESQGRRRRNVCTLTERGRQALAAAARTWGGVLPQLTTLVEHAPHDARCFCTESTCSC